MPVSLVWFRRDLRLEDNPALAAARATGGAVIPVWIGDEAGDAGWAPGGASRWWLHHSLAALGAALRARGSQLVLRHGDTVAELRRLQRATGATHVFWNRAYEPAARRQEALVAAALAEQGTATESGNAALLFEPAGVTNRAGGPFQVFTPYWRHCLTLPVAEPVKLPRGPLPAPAVWPESLELERLQLLPRINWAAGFTERWQPGEAAALQRLKQFLPHASDYAEQRDRPAVTGTSGLSAHLHFGEIGPRQIWAAVKARSADSGVFPASRGAQVFLAEVGWREFAHHLLWHFPRTPREPLRAEFARFPWRTDPAQLRAWQRGLTGYPIVDAGMRELWHTGWMHNRVRMIVASFLLKHLRLSWQEGAAWFWDTLVDADLAANTLGWQWSAGCGADAAPYFRIFNPILQGRKFDPNGDYVCRWVPELRRLPTEWIHAPWEASPEVLVEAGIWLGQDYPAPLVNHSEARVAALAAYQKLRQ